MLNICWYDIRIRINTDLIQGIVALLSKEIAQNLQFYEFKTGIFYCILSLHFSFTLIEGNVWNDISSIILCGIWIPHKVILDLFLLNNYTFNLLLLKNYFYLLAFLFLTVFGHHH